MDNNKEVFKVQDAINRRTFLSSACGFGMAAFAGLMSENGYAAAAPDRNAKTGGLMGLPHFPPKVKRVIYLFQSGAPSQMELFDYKPKLNDYRGQDLPDSIRNGQRLTGMTSGQSHFPVAPSVYGFKQHGKAGIWLSELMPHTATIADEMYLHFENLRI